MGLWLGLQKHSPLEQANTATAGEDGWWIKLRSRPSPDKPMRAAVSTPCGSSVFESPEDAMGYVAHPGETPLMALFYLGFCEARGESLN